MKEYKATFEVASKTDAYAVERALNQLYDTLREESRTTHEGTSDSTEAVEQFAAVRDAARDPTPGTLTVRYEQHGESFEE